MNQRPIPAYLAEREELRHQLRSFYEGACEEQESVNGLKEWIPNGDGPSPEGYFHPEDIAHITIEMNLPGSYELGMDTIAEITQWLIWA